MTDRPPPGAGRPGRVLVTGGFGYLGARVANDLAAAGWQVTATSRHSQPPFALAPGVRTLCLDLLGPASDLDTALAGQDAVLHLAAPNEVQALQDPIAALSGTAATTVALLAAAGRQGLRRLIYLSTAQVYGRALAGRVEESTLPLPLHPYAIAHRAAEDYVLAAAAQGRVPGLVLRLANAVGAPAAPTVERWTLVGNDLCRQAVTQGRLTLRSDGAAWRSLVAIADVLAALRLLLAADWSPLSPPLLNLGGEALRIADFARLVAARAGARLGRQVEIAFGPAEGPAVAFDYRSDRLAALGWRAATPLAAAIDETLAFCAAHADRLA